jgi:aspartyl-tRNA(Asn)/glutamyl-tRNA(Gln) amidotransferase subunit C
MNKVSVADVKKLAKLARLRLSEAELTQFAREFSELLNYVTMLSDVDTAGLEPTFQVSGLKNIMRADEVIDYTATQAELLKNAPATENGQFKVRRVIE